MIKLNHTNVKTKNPGKETTQDILESLLKEGARKMLQQAIENEVFEYVETHRSFKDEQGHQQVKLNGFQNERTLLTSMGCIKIKPRRVLDRREGESFSSNILPKYIRKIPSIDNLVPALYLKGISSGEFTKALESILGKDAPGLSATNIVRLKECWMKDYQAWNQRDLSFKKYVYVWADGIYFNVRLDRDRPCILVLMGALEDGTKELIAVHDGYRENKISWKEIISDLKRRGLKIDPKLAVGDGALGFWAAIREEWPETKEQRCWVHKTGNILNKMPKSVQSTAKKMIHDIYLAPKKEDALKAFDSFIKTYEVKYYKATQCLQKDKEVLLSFYDFPAEHWQHIRSTNPIESTFGTVRHRTKRTKGCANRRTTLMMVFKLAMEAQTNWRKLKGYKLIPLVLENVKFIDGELKNKVA